MSFAKTMVEIDDVKLMADMYLEAGKNSLKLISLLKEISSLSAQGYRQTFLWVTKGFWETKAQLLAMGAQLRVEGFTVIVMKNLGQVYLWVKW